MTTLIQTAQAFSAVANSYQSTESGKQQFKLRYELKDMYSQLAERTDAIREQLTSMGADLAVRLKKWDAKFKLLDREIVSEDTFFAKAQEYVAHYDSEAHQTAMKASDVAEVIFPFQAAVLEALKEGRDVRQELLDGGLNEKNDERVFGRVNNWTQQFAAGNLDYFKKI